MALTKFHFCDSQDYINFTDGIEYKIWLSDCGYSLLFSSDSTYEYLDYDMYNDSFTISKPNDIKFVDPHKWHVRSKCLYLEPAFKYVIKYDIHLLTRDSLILLDNSPNNICDTLIFTRAFNQSYPRSSRASN